MRETSEPVTFRGHQDLTLVGDAVGPADGAPVLLLHGGGQTRHAWGATAHGLARVGARAISLDLRGHGDSAWASDGDYALASFAADVVAVVRALGRAPVAVGASLGGLASLLAEGEHAPLLAGLVLVDVAPRLEEDGVRRIVSFMDSGVDGFDSLEAAADAIARYLPHRPRPRDLGGLSKNLRQRADGRWYWHWDPRFVRRDRGDTSYSRERLDRASRALRVPTLLVRGKKSDVLSEEAVREFQALVPHAGFVDVAGAAHMVAGDDNDAFSLVIERFLAELRGGN